MKYLKKFCKELVYEFEVKTTWKGVVFLFFWFLLTVGFMLLVGCSQLPLHIATDSKALKTPTIQWQAPPKQILASVKWNFPRLANKVVVKNSTKCLKLGKRGILYNPEDLAIKCSTPAIDNGSNLYIGLTESNYRNLVNNYNILIMREKRWTNLLKQINKQLKVDEISNKTNKISNR